MAAIGRTLLRLTGAVLLGASAASIDNPGLLYAPTASGLGARARSAPEQARSEPEVRIAPGKMSLAFRFDDAGDLVGLAKPNSRVDIVLVANDPEQGKPMAKLVMENMRLLAIGAVPGRLPDGRSINAAIATIEVTPDEAERFRLAKAKGSLRLLLRGYRDADSVGPGTRVSPLIRTR